MRRPCDGLPPLLHVVVHVTERDTLLRDVVPAIKSGGMAGAEDPVIPQAVVISKSCSLAITVSQSIENQSPSYKVCEKKHYMECFPLL